MKSYDDLGVHRVKGKHRKKRLCIFNFNELFSFYLTFIFAHLTPLLISVPESNSALGAL